MSRRYRDRARGGVGCGYGVEERVPVCVEVARAPGRGSKSMGWDGRVRDGAEPRVRRQGRLPARYLSGRAVIAGPVQFGLVPAFMPAGPDWAGIMTRTRQAKHSPSIAKAVRKHLHVRVGCVCVCVGVVVGRGKERRLMGGSGGGAGSHDFAARDVGGHGPVLMPRAKISSHCCTLSPARPTHIST